MSATAEDRGHGWVEGAAEDRGKGGVSAAAKDRGQGGVPAPSCYIGKRPEATSFIADRGQGWAAVTVSLLYVRVHIYAGLGGQLLQYSLCRG